MPFSLFSMVWFFFLFQISPGKNFHSKPAPLCSQLSDTSVVKWLFSKGLPLPDLSEVTVS